MSEFVHEIRYSSEFNDAFIRLTVRAEKGDGKSKYLLSLIIKANAKLFQNKEAGTKIPRKLWPVEYLQKYGVTNLWKYKLDSNWRLLYTITGDQVRFFVIYLEYLRHKEYERKFGYKRS